MKINFLLPFLLFSVLAISQGTWTQKANFGGTVRYNGVGFSIAPKGYIGTGDDTSPYAQDFWEWDVSTNVWTQKANFGGGGRSGAVGFSINNKGYIGTGSIVGTPANTDFWEYYPLTNVWTQKANFPGVPRTDAVGFSINSKGYLGTGTNGTSIVYNDFWEYDPNTNIWTQKANFTGIARSAAVGFSINTKGYIGLGTDASINSLNDFWEYDPAVDAWIQKASFPGGGGADMVGFSISPKGYVGINLSTTDFWEWDQLTNVWTQKTNFTGTGRTAAVGFSIGTMGYVGIGLGTSGLTKDFWAFDRSQIPVTPILAGFQKTYGGTFNDEAYSAQQTDDGGYIIVGMAGFVFGQYADVYLVKTDSVGTLLWTRTFGGTAIDWGKSVIQTQDGGYAITGYTKSFGVQGEDVCIIKCDTGGNLLWSRTIGGSGKDIGNAVRETNDGGFVVAGSTSSFGAGLDDVYIVKFNSSGTLLWTKTFGGTYADRAFCIYQTTDGNLIFGGEKGKYLATDGYLLKTDASGNKLWEKSISAGSSGSHHIFHSIQETTDKGYILADETSNGTSGATSGLVKIDSLGMSIWAKTYVVIGSSCFSAQPTIDGGFILACGMNSAGLIKTNSAGDMLWARNYSNGWNFGSACFAQQIDGGGFVQIGTKKLTGGDFDFYMMVTDSLGNAACDMNIPNTYTVATVKTTNNVSLQVSSGGVVGNPTMVSGIGGFQADVCSNVVMIPETSSVGFFVQISPNPTIGIFLVTSEKSISQIEIYNIVGEKIYTSQVSSSKSEIDLCNQPSGMYFLQIKMEGATAIGKIIKQ